MSEGQETTLITNNDNENENENDNDIFIRCLTCIDIHIVSYIYTYVPRHVKVWLNKTNYVSKHTVVTDLIKSKHLYDSYLRNILRNDLSFVFDTILHQEYDRLWEVKKYVYKKRTYRNYNEFMDKFIFENSAHRCRDVLFNNVYRKKYRKIRNNISWRR